MESDHWWPNIYRSIPAIMFSRSSWIIAIELELPHMMMVIVAMMVMMTMMMVVVQVMRSGGAWQTEELPHTEFLS